MLQQIAVDARLAPSTQAERGLARAHVPVLAAQDMVLTDRGDAGYRWLIEVRAREAHFISRCSRASFAAAPALFARDVAGVSQVVTLPAPQALRAECRARGWPLELAGRFLTVRLATGELAVLASSLLEETGWPTEGFGEVYWRRWGQETFYARLKGRLDLEHCSGQTVAAVAPDFHALILLSNVESVGLGPVPAEWAEASAAAVGRAVPGPVNRAVSLHALKSRLIDLLASAPPAEAVLAELTGWFLHNPTRVRPGRKVRRRKFSPSRSYHDQRRVRKLVF